MHRGPEQAPRYRRHGRYWLPERGAAAWRFYDSTLRVPQSRRELAASTLLRATPWARAAPPASRSPESGREPAPDLAQLGLQSRERLAEAGIHPAGDIELVALEDYEEQARGQIIVFLVETGSNRPLAVAKVATNPDHRARLEREGEVLTRLHSELPDVLRRSIPRQIGAFVDGPVSVVLQTAIPGRSFYCQLRNDLWPRRHVAAHLRRAREWLVAFQKATFRREQQLDDEGVDAYVTAPLEAVARMDDAPPEVRAEIDRVTSRARSLRGERFPVVARHGDYWARNVLRTGATLGVVDWEHYRDEGAAFFDAFLFVTAHGAVFPWRLGTWADPVEAFRRTFCQRNWMSRLVRDELGAWCRAHDISAELLDVFFSTFLAECVLVDSARPRPGSRINGAGKWQRLLQEHARRVESACSG